MHIITRYLFTVKPSEGIWQLYEDGGLPDILMRLGDCPQSPEWHPEGDVLMHTLLVIDQAAKYMKELPPHWQIDFMWGMLLHDIGKPATLNPETFTTYGHDQVGAKITKEFIKQNMRDIDADKVSSIVAGHMRILQLARQNSSLKAWKKLNNICPLNILAYVSMCDRDGREGVEKLGKNHPSFIKATEMYEVIRCQE